MFITQAPTSHLLVVSFCTVGEHERPFASKGLCSVKGLQGLCGHAPGHAEQGHAAVVRLGLADDPVVPLVDRPARVPAGETLEPE